MEKAAAEDFWKFVVLRQQAYWKHRNQDGPPYSDDPAIAKYHFCNVYREADRGTIWFHEHRPDGLEAVLFASLAYRTINRIDTFDAFGGLPTFASIERFLQFIAERSEAGEKVFTGRHLTTGFKSYERLVGFLTDREQFDALIRDVYAVESVKALVKRLVKVPGIGAFFGWQVACDLLEANVLSEAVRATQDAWTQLGPGATRGAKLVSPEGDPLATAIELLDYQPTDGSLVPPPMAPGPFTLKNIEHALCEYVRWKRASDTDVKNVGLEVRAWAK